VARRAGDVVTLDGLGVCTAERACIARFRSGVDQACPWHVDVFDPRHSAQIDARRALLGDRMHLTIPEFAVLAGREPVDLDDDRAVAIA
jgi:hypothetical protein